MQKRTATTNCDSSLTNNPVTDTDLTIPSASYENTKSLNIPVCHVQEPTMSQISSVDETQTTSIPDVHFAQKADIKEGEYAKDEL